MSDNSAPEGTLNRLADLTQQAADLSAGLARLNAKSGSVPERTQLDLIETAVDDLRVKFQLLSEFLYNRLGRPYYALDDGWALTHLNTGAPFYVNTRERGISPWIIMGGLWEPEVDKVIATFIRPGMRVADIGANMGYHTVKLGALIGADGHVDAFEANPEMQRFVEANMNLNSLMGTLHRFALGSAPGTAELTFPVGFAGQASLLGRATANGCEVEVRTLDSALNGAIVDFIKLDVEGYELHVLAGAKATLAASAHCALLVETTLAWEGFEDLPSLVGDRKPYLIDSDGRLTPVTFDALPEYLRTQPLGQSNILYCPDSRKDHIAALL